MTSSRFFVLTPFLRLKVIEKHGYFQSIVSPTFCILYPYCKSGFKFFRLNFFNKKITDNRKILYEFLRLSMTLQIEFVCSRQTILLAVFWKVLLRLCLSRTFLSRQTILIQLLFFIWDVERPWYNDTWYKFVSPFLSRSTDIGICIIRPRYDLEQPVSRILHTFRLSFVFPPFIFFGCIKKFFCYQSIPPLCKFTAF